LRKYCIADVEYGLFVLTSSSFYVPEVLNDESTAIEFMKGPMKSRQNKMLEHSMSLNFGSLTRSWL
jgi:hypothetical protein